MQITPRQAAQRLLDALAAALPHAPHCAEFDRVADAADDLRAARLCEELGHAGDTLAALEELQSLRSGVTDERTRLRAQQATAVMPLIGPLLDAWECCSQSVRSEHPELDKQLRRINRAMEDAGDERPNGPR